MTLTRQILKMNNETVLKKTFCLFVCLFCMLRYKVKLSKTDTTSMQKKKTAQFTARFFFWCLLLVKYTGFIVITGNTSEIKVWRVNSTRTVIWKSLLLSKCKLGLYLTYTICQTTVNPYHKCYSDVQFTTVLCQFIWSTR